MPQRRRIFKKFINFLHFTPKLPPLGKYTISCLLSQMLHTKFGKDWPNSSWEDDVNRQTTHDNGCQPIAISHLNKSGDLKLNQSVKNNHKLSNFLLWWLKCFCHMSVPVLRGPRKMTEVLSDSKREATDMTLISPFGDLPQKQTYTIVIKQRKNNFSSYNTIKHKILTSDSLETTIPPI